MTQEKNVITSVNDTSDKLFTGVNDTGNKCSPVSTTLPINFSPAINCIDDRGLFFLQNCKPCGKNKDATVRRQQCV